MSILINEDTRVLVQGITGREGSFHTSKMIEYGTKVVGGITPGKGGEQSIHNLPIYNSFSIAKNETNANASVLFVPPRFALDAALEAIEAEIELLICITEGIPILDMVKIKAALKNSNTKMIGPNCPGVISPGKSKIGIMPGFIHKQGNIGIISRSGTLTYEAVSQVCSVGMGQSTCIGIGGDPIIGTGYIELLNLFEQDDETEAVIMIGEIGGNAEEKAAEFIKTNMTKPVIAFIAGATAPKGRRMGHAGAIISGGKGTAEEKKKVLIESGIAIAESPADIGITVKEILQKK